MLGDSGKGGGLMTPGVYFGTRESPMGLEKRTEK